ncbi:hypothetical protein HPB51_019075 [Rhipicephalus microplus]|uniref:Uncharacterized protein n=1 Tax=Rhipicephalus microplus TaxID=6941 RepID=A0A9J6D6S4_RHIMP|nr:hypothetical protein HPB51_019075 [Rhipicephalus microplus]
MEEWKWVRRSSETAAAVKTKAAPSQLARHGRSQPGDADHRMGSRENAAGRPPSPGKRRARTPDAVHFWNHQRTAHTSATVNAVSALSIPLLSHGIGIGGALPKAAAAAFGPPPCDRPRGVVPPLLFHARCPVHHAHSKGTAAALLITALMLRLHLPNPGPITHAQTRGACVCVGRRDNATSSCRLSPQRAFSLCRAKACLPRAVAAKSLHQASTLASHLFLTVLKYLSRCGSSLAPYPSRSLSHQLSHYKYAAFLF